MASNRYGKKAAEKVERAMHEMKRGKLKSGRSGRQVTNPKQAIAIGLSEARAAGGKVPTSPKKSTAKKKTAKKATPKKAAANKATTKRPTPKRATAKKATTTTKKATTKKATTKRATPKKATTKRATTASPKRSVTKKAVTKKAAPKKAAPKKALAKSTTKTTTKRATKPTTRKMVATPTPREPIAKKPRGTSPRPRTSGADNRERSANVENPMNGAIREVARAKTVAQMSVDRTNGVHHDDDATITRGDDGAFEARLGQETEEQGTTHSDTRTTSDIVNGAHEQHDVQRAAMMSFVNQTALRAPPPTKPLFKNHRVGLHRTPHRG